MAQYLGPIFGTGKDGYLTVSGTQNINTRTGASGTAGNRTLTVDSISGFSSGDLVMIHKSRGETTTTCGSWELNRLYTAPSGNTLYIDVPLTYNYQDSGNDQSQVVKVPEYLGVLVSSSTYITPTAWDGSTGGITIFCCNGKTIINSGGGITANGGAGAQATSGNGGGCGTGGGFRGGAASWGRDNNYGSQGYWGEGTGGDKTSKTPSANGNGGGGGTHNNSAVGNAGAGGGGSNGGNGTAGQGGAQGGGGTYGSTSGNSALSYVTFGGAGAGGGGGYNYSSDEAGGGGAGGGIIIIMSKIFINSGSVISNGGNGGPTNVWADGSGGGGGAGGSILIKSQNATLGSSIITATGGDGGHDNGGEHRTRVGGIGGDGRVRIEANNLTGSTSPTYSSYGTLVPWAGGIGIMG